jgi:hypothetical protein
MIEAPRRDIPPDKLMAAFDMEHSDKPISKAH